jgi:hypothetical protein
MAALRVKVVAPVPLAPPTGMHACSVTPVVTASLKTCRLGQAPRFVPSMRTYPFTTGAVMRRLTLKLPMPKAAADGDQTPTATMRGGA